MVEHPKIKLGEWIYVGQVPAVVSRLKNPNDAFTKDEIVFDPEKPTNRDVEWNGWAWQFVQSGDYGGYAEKYDRLRTYVAILKRGR